jgi:hypothetical protein
MDWSWYDGLWTPCAGVLKLPTLAFYFTLRQGDMDMSMSMSMSVLLYLIDWYQQSHLIHRA